MTALSGKYPGTIPAPGDLGYTAEQPRSNTFNDRWLACQAHFHEVFVDALASDLEHGVKWLNEQAAEEFKQKYPALTKALEAISDY